VNELERIANEIGVHTKREVKSSIDQSRPGDVVFLDITQNNLSALFIDVTVVGLCTASFRNNRKTVTQNMSIVEKKKILKYENLWKNNLFLRRRRAFVSWTYLGCLSNLFYKRKPIIRLSVPVLNDFEEMLEDAVELLEDVVPLSWFNTKSTTVGARDIWRKIMGYIAIEFSKNDECWAIESELDPITRDHTFCPFGISSFGLFGTNAEKILALLANRISFCSIESIGEITKKLKQRILMALLNNVAGNMVNQISYQGIFIE